MSERLQKLIAAAGVTSRRNAETLISEGRVTVNGLTASLGDKADPDTDRICLDGKRLDFGSAPVYYVLNKPRGVVTSMCDDKGRRDLREFTSSIDDRVFPVGRLDMDSSGLLLLTNDGDFANRAAHPSGEIVKAYVVRVKGFTDGGFQRLRGEMDVDGHTVTADRVQLLRDDGTSALVLIGIHQGLNRQVRKMCALCDMSVLSLKRIAEGGLRLGDLKEGEIRRISAGDADKVFSKTDFLGLVVEGGLHG